MMCRWVVVCVCDKQEILKLNLFLFLIQDFYRSLIKENYLKIQDLVWNYHYENKINRRSNDPCIPLSPLQFHINIPTIVSFEPTNHHRYRNQSSNPNRYRSTITASIRHIHLWIKIILHSIHFIFRSQSIHIRSSNEI